MITSHIYKLPYIFFDLVVCFINTHLDATNLIFLILNSFHLDSTLRKPSGIFVSPKFTSLKYHIKLISFHKFTYF
jgi:hypothetical protein